MTIDRFEKKAKAKGGCRICVNRQRRCSWSDFSSSPASRPWRLPITVVQPPTLSSHPLRSMMPVQCTLAVLLKQRMQPTSFVFKSKTSALQRVRLRWRCCCRAPHRRETWCWIHGPWRDRSRGLQFRHGVFVGGHHRQQPDSEGEGHLVGRCSYDQRRRSDCAWSTSHNIKQQASRPVNIPQPAAGETSVVWSQTVHDFSIEVLNTGVKNQSARFWLNFTEVGNPGNTFSLASGIRIRCPPRLHSQCRCFCLPISLTFDASSPMRTGEWDVVGTMYAAGLNWHDDVEFPEPTGCLLKLRLHHYACARRSVEPGQTSTLTFLIKNTGVLSDDYTVTQSNLSGWVTAMSPSSKPPPFHRMPRHP